MQIGDIVEGELVGDDAREIEYRLAAGDVFCATLVTLDRPVTFDVRGPDGTAVGVEQGGRSSIREVSFTARHDGIYRLRIGAPADGRSRRFAMRPHPRVPADKTASHPRVHPWVAALTDSPLRSGPPSDSQDVSGGREELEAFWNRVATNGTPLIEDRDAALADLWVTFVWRGQPDTRDVLLLAAGQRRMSRVADTDVWFKTLAIRRGARLAYAFLPQRGDGPVAPDELALDPLNADRFPADENASDRATAARPAGVDHITRSVVTLPQAGTMMIRMAPGPFAPAGRVVAETFHSAVLRNHRTLWTYTPPGYDEESTACSVLVMFDGEDYLGPIGLPAILDRLSLEARIPPTLAVFVGSPGVGTRWHELRCERPIVDALSTELMPWLRQRYRVADDPASIIVGGSSRGALAAAWVALSAPETFGGALCQSGAFWWAPDGEPLEIERFNPYHEPNWLAREVARRDRVPVRISLLAGTYEGRDSDQGPILEHTRHLRDVLVAKRYDVRYRECFGGHDVLTWHSALPEAIADMFTKPEAAPA
jgi:enterochelin esterase-like enzyme